MGPCCSDCKICPIAIHECHCAPSGTESDTYSLLRSPRCWGQISSVVLMTGLVRFYCTLNLSLLFVVHSSETVVHNITYLTIHNRLLIWIELTCYCLATMPLQQLHPFSGFRFQDDMNSFFMKGQRGFQSTTENLWHDWQNSGHLLDGCN